MPILLRKREKPTKNRHIVRPNHAVLPQNVPVYVMPAAISAMRGGLQLKLARNALQRADCVFIHFGVFNNM